MLQEAHAMLTDSPALFYAFFLLWFQHGDDDSRVCWETCVSARGDAAGPDKASPAFELFPSLAKMHIWVNVQLQTRLFFRPKRFCYCPKSHSQPCMCVSPMFKFAVFALRLTKRMQQPWFHLFFSAGYSKSLGINISIELSVIPSVLHSTSQINS